MMTKIGVTDTQVENLISTMPETKSAERDAEALALLVFHSQQTFQRANTLLNNLWTAAGPSAAAVNSAWRAAEQVVW